jgi:hypothetical protein
VYIDARCRQTLNNPLKDLEEIDDKENPSTYQVIRLPAHQAEDVHRVYLGNHARSGWREELPFYAFECQAHRTVINYPQGYERRLAYPLCDKEPIPQMG